MGEQFAHPFSVLKLLTPDNIANLAILVEGSKKISLTDLIDEMREESESKFAEVPSIHEAKILLFEMEKADVEETAVDVTLPEEEAKIIMMPEQAGKDAESESDISREATAEVKKRTHFFEEIEEEEEEEESFDESDFILSQKEKLQGSVKKMREGEILYLYKKNKQETKRSSKKGSGDLRTGVLVNKKQA